MRMILWVSLICIGKLTSDAALDPPGLVAVAVAHAFALFVGVSIAANISGGHLNPAVTFGLAVGGNISILTGIFYWIAQCLGSIVACLLLKFVTNGEVYFLGNKREKKKKQFISQKLVQKLIKLVGLLLTYIFFNVLALFIYFYYRIFTRDLLVVAKLELFLKRINK